MSKTNNTIENFPERFKEKLEQFLKRNPHLVDDEGKPGGYFRVFIGGGSAVVELFEYGQRGHTGFSTACGTTAPSDQDRRLMINTVQSICAERGFSPLCARAMRILKNQ